MRRVAVLAFLLLACPAFAADEPQTGTDRLEFHGDLRLRYENIDEEGEAGRERARFRTRFGVSAAVSPDVEVVVRLATGGDDPVSTNQSFGDGFSTKDIGVDLAYVDWHAAPGLRILGGKMKNPLFRPGGDPLVWDGDLNPEGVAARYAQGAWFANAGVFSVEERSSASDSLLHAAQLGRTFDLTGSATLTAGVGYFAYTQTVGASPFYDGSPNGNSVDAGGLYVYDYRDTEWFAQVTSRLGERPFLAFAHWVRNEKAGDEDTGWALGVKLGSAKAPGDWALNWTYRDIGADSEIGTFSDSDFGGGGTDVSGHVLKGVYAVSARIGLGATFFVNRVDRFQGDEHDYRRLQLDVEFKFE